MDVQISRQRGDYHLLCRKQRVKHFHEEGRRERVQNSSTFESIRHFIDSENSFHIHWLAEGVRKQQVALEMTCMDQYWLIDCTLSIKNPEMRQALFLLLLALKIKFNYVCDLAESFWNKAEIIEFVCFYSLDVTVINLRDPKFVQMLLRRAQLSQPWAECFYLETLNQLYSCLSYNQRLILLPLIDRCIQSEDEDKQLPALRMALSLAESSGVETSRLVSLPSFWKMVQLGNTDIETPLSSLSFSISRSLLSKQEEQCYELIKITPIVDAAEKRLFREEQVIREEAEEVVCYILQLVSNPLIISRLSKHLYQRYSHDSNTRIKQHIITTVNSLLSEVCILQEVIENTPGIFVILLEGLSAKNTEIIEASLNSVQSLTQTVHRQALHNLGIETVLQNLADYPIERISREAESLICFYQ